MAGFYAAYHGSEGLKKIATRVLRYRQVLLTAFKWMGIEVDDTEGFDTIRFKSFLSVDGFNVRYEGDHTIISLDELTTLDEIQTLINSQKDLVNQNDTIDHIVDAVGKYKWKYVPERTNLGYNKKYLTSIIVKQI